MSEFASEKWIAELAAAAASETAPPDLTLSIDQVISDTARWRVTIDGGTVTVDPAPTGEADVRIVTDAETARAVHAGEESAQRAFLDGRLRIGGDIPALMAHREALAALGLDAS